MRLYALLFLIFLASCAPIAKHPESIRSPGTVVSMVFYHTMVNQEKIRRGLEDYYRGLDVGFSFSYDIGPGLSLLITDEQPEQWKLAPNVAGSAPETCTPKTVAVALVLRCAQSEEVCSYSAAHELGHLLGLQHVVGDDMMAPDYKPGLRLTDRWLPAVPNRCQVLTQNSQAYLRQVLGPAPGPRP